MLLARCGESPRRLVGLDQWVAKHNKCPGYRDIGGFCSVESAFDGMDISFYESSRLVVMRAESCMFVAIFAGEDALIFGLNGCSLSVTLLGSSFEGK